jgi:threonine/homoserine/homoserine lactone efflux protein
VVAVLAFLGLCTLLVAIPGPATMLVVKNAASRGFGSAMTTAFGVLAADLIWMAASVVGLTAVLVAFEPAFLAVRLLGAAYLVLLGVRLLLSRGGGLDVERGASERVARGRAFREGVLCDLSNPKTLLIFTSVIPQFLSGDVHPLALGLYGTLFAVVGLAALTAYAAVFAQARRITRRPAVQRWFLRASGAVLVLLGGRLAVKPA